MQSRALNSELTMPKLADVIASAMCSTLARATKLGLLCLEGH